MIPKILLAAAALLAGCAPATVRLSGAETRGRTDSPRVVPAAVTPVAEGTQMQLVSTDGIVLTGLLTRQQQPIVVPIAATGEPLVGGAIELAGDISGDTLVMTCRFRLLNPPRGIDGGGAGRCEGSGRRVDFLF